MSAVIAHLKLSQQLYIVYSTTTLYVVIWCSTTGQVSHIFITAENALISVNFQLFLLCFLLHIVVVVYYTTTRRTTTTTTEITPMRMKRFI